METGKWHGKAAHRGAQAGIICIASAFGLGPETRGEMIGWVMPARRYSSSLRRHWSASPTKAILSMSSVGISWRASSWLPSFQSRRTARSSSVKPVLAINAVIWWMALRENDIQDKLYGYGRMLSDF